MKRKMRRRANIFVIALAVLVGLLWAGVLDAEMKWTATMFGLALAAGFSGEPQPGRRLHSGPIRPTTN